MLAGLILWINFASGQRCILGLVDKCNINPSYRSDHSIIDLQICLNTFIQGKCFWKFNNSLLKNEQYLNLVNNIICEEKLACYRS